MVRLTTSEFRSHFPLLTQRTYVNSCSQGALSTDVHAAMQQFLDSWNREGSPWEAWVGEVERLRSTFAALIGADADEVAILPSASIGINAIASALMFNGPRHQVVMGRFEFPTMAQVWLAQRQRAGGAATERVPFADRHLKSTADVQRRGVILFDIGMPLRLVRDGHWLF